MMDEDKIHKILTLTKDGKSFQNAKFGMTSTPLAPIRK